MMIYTIMYRTVNCLFQIHLLSLILSYFFHKVCISLQHC